MANSENPYAPPEASSSEAATINWNGDYALFPGGVRCRAAVQFPPICLLTGETEDLQPVQFTRKAKISSHLERNFVFLVQMTLNFIIFCFFLESFGLRPSWIPDVFFHQVVLLQYVAEPGRRLVIWQNDPLSRHYGKDICQSFRGRSIDTTPYPCGWTGLQHDRNANDLRWP